MSEVAHTIDKREGQHGNYEDTARIAQALKHVVKFELVKRNQRKQSALSNIQVESLDLICTKIARIISGDPTEQDHWHDIAGYAGLAERELRNLSTTAYVAEALAVKGHSINEVSISNTK